MLADAGRNAVRDLYGNRIDRRDPSPALHAYHHGLRVEYEANNAW